MGIKDDGYNVNKTVITDTDGNNATVDSLGQLHVVLDGQVDENNSTETPLVGDDTWVGSATRVTPYSAIAVFVTSDVESADRGLLFEFSFDGVEWWEGESYTIEANAEKFFTPPVQSVYFRASYTNGNDAQGNFHLHTMLKKSPIKWSSHNLNDTLSDDDDGTLNLSVLKLRTSQDTYVSAASTTSGNFKVSLEEFENGVSSNSNSQLNVTAFDSDGNEFKSVEDGDGDYNLGTSVIQSVFTDSNNSSTTNLDAGNSYTFTGVGTSTLGVVGLQWSLKTDQNATVYIEQSPDNSNWDISDTFDYLYSKGGYGSTVQALNSYWRIRVILTGTSATTYFRLQGILCPIAEPLPRSLDNYGRLKTAGCIIDCETGSRAEVDGVNSLKTASMVRLVGTGFDGTTLDTNFWTATSANAASATIAGELIVSTGTTANGEVEVNSVRTARKVPGTVNQFRFVGRLATALEANNLRRTGAYNDDNGFFFQINGTTFGIGSRKGTSDTIVNSGSFNGNLGTDVTMDTNTHRLVIEYSGFAVKYFVDNTLLHTLTSDTSSYSNTLSLPIRIENVNSGGNDTNNIILARVATIVRLGDLITNPAYKHISAAGTYVCKYGPGKIHGIAVNDPSLATTLTVYDNTSAAAPVMASLVTTSKVITPFYMNYEISFNTGLTIVTNATSDYTIIYE